MYRLLREILFLLPAEAAHYFSMNCLKALCAVGFVRNLLQKTFSHHSPLTTQLFGLSFKNPVGLGAGFVFRDPHLGAVIAAAMLINIAVAGLAGVLVPVVLERLDQDPAVASSVFVTMITDSMGFFAFLGLAVATGLVG